MKNALPLTRGLRIAAVTILLAASATWLGTGRHLGWTQTSVVTLQHDEITGIDYPQREDRFVAGLEVLVLAAATSATLAGLSLVTRRRAFSAA
jgi:hypothetical protein